MKYQPTNPDKHGIRRCTYDCEQYLQNDADGNERCRLFDCYCSALSPCEAWARELTARAVALYHASVGNIHTAAAMLAVLEVQRGGSDGISAE